MSLNGSYIFLQRNELEATKIRPNWRGWLIIERMVISMNETRLCTAEQIEQFLSVYTQIGFSKSGGETTIILSTSTTCPTVWPSYRWSNAIVHLRLLCAQIHAPKTDG